MVIERKNFYIISGGPGSGKTAIIEQLCTRGYQCIGEVGRQIIQEQEKIGGDATHWKNQVKFLDFMLSRSIYVFEEMKETNLPVFFDRGIPELIGYCRLIKKNIPLYLINAVNLHHYNKMVFLTPPWKDIYHHDAERKQSYIEAIETYNNIARAYDEAGYQLVEIPKVDVSARIDFILKHITISS